MKLLPKFAAGGAVLLFLIALEREMALQTPRAWLPAIFFGLLIAYALRAPRTAIDSPDAERWVWDVRGVFAFLIVPATFALLLAIDVYSACHGGWAAGGAYCADIQKLYGERVRDRSR